MRYFSVAYKPLEWPLPRWVEPVSTRPAGDGVTDLGIRYPDLAGRDPELGEFATLFAVRRVLEEEGGDGHDGEMVGLSHYRRFAVTSPIRSSSQHGMALRPAQFAKISRDRLLPPPGTLLLPAPIAVDPSLLGQYSHHHEVRDLLFFSALAVDAGLVPDDVMSGYLTGQVLVAAPTVGIFPRAWLIDVLTQLELVADAFAATRQVPREGYQRRAPAFCLERVHSLLLLMLVGTWPSNRVEAHPALVVSPDGVYRGNDGSGA